MTHYFFPKEIKTETKSQSALFGGGGERTPVPLESRDQRVNGIIVSYLSYYQASYQPCGVKDLVMPAMTKANTSAS